MNEIEEKILRILGENLPLNTSQVCRMYHGATSRYDINFCTSGRKDEWKDKGNFERYGHNLYPNCIGHEPGYNKIYYRLGKLGKLGLAESRVEWRTDPIVRGRKDRMRMWALKGRLPSLDGFVM